MLSLPVWTGQQEVVQVETLQMAEVLVPADGDDQDPLEVSAQKFNIFFVIKNYNIFFNEFLFHIQDEEGLLAWWKTVEGK